MTLPELHLADWRPTKDTLHLYAQIVGKIRLATTAPRNHWWNVALYTDVRGLSTRRLHHRDTTFEITIDFLDHALIVGTADGRTRSFRLDDGLSVADFDARLHATLAELGIDVEIKELPFGVPMTTPFPRDVEHASWDREAVQRFGRILDWSDSVFEEFSGWFNGKTSPVHLFWHSLDLAVTRFSGRPGPSIDADPVTQEAYSHEVISFGFWPGDDNLGDAAYYSYTAPEPEGLRDQPLPVGEWTESGSGSLAIVPYEALRTSHDPRTTLLAFCQGAYEAGARLAGWDTSSFESKWCPTPNQLKQLQATAAADFGPPHRERLTWPALSTNWSDHNAGKHALKTPQTPSRCATGRGSSSAAQPVATAPSSGSPRRAAPCAAAPSGNTPNPTNPQTMNAEDDSRITASAPEQLRLEDSPNANRYEAHLGDALAGVLDYHAQPGLITLLHTEVARRFEGRGFASQLIAHALDDIRDRGMQVLPICPFVIAYIEQHPEYKEILRFP